MDTKKLILLFSVATVFQFRDLFTTDLSAGNVDGTASEPGPGTRNIVDTGGTGVRITGGYLEITANGNWNQRGFYMTPGITREAGVVVKFQFNNVGESNGMMMITSAQDADFAGYNNKGIAHTLTGITARRSSGASSPEIVTGLFAGILYMVLRAAGRFVFYDNGTNVKLIWFDNWDSTATLYVGATHFTITTVLRVLEFAIPQSRYYSMTSHVLASDTFNRANGTLGNTDGDVLAEGGGDGVAWSDDEGTWAIASNVASASALESSVAIATVETNEEDVLIDCDLVRSAGNVGIVARYTDSSNYLIAYHDGTNAKLDEVVAGTPNNLISAAATYSANAPIRLSLDGQNARLYYNELVVGATASIDAGLTGTQHGLYTTDTSNTQNDFVCIPSFGYNDIRL